MRIVPMNEVSVRLRGKGRKHQWTELEMMLARLAKDQVLALPQKEWQDHYLSKSGLAEACRVIAKRFGKKVSVQFAKDGNGMMDALVYFAAGE